MRKGELMGLETRNRSVRRRTPLVLAACSVVFLAAACSKVISGASAPPPTIVPVTSAASSSPVSSAVVSSAVESSSAVSSSGESSSSQGSLPPISSGDTPTAISSFAVDTSGLTAITQPPITPTTSTSVPSTPTTTTSSSTSTKTTPSTTRTTATTDSEKHNYIKVKGKGGTITIDFPLCAKAESANGGNAQRYGCDDITDMVSFVYVDLTAQPKLDTAQFNQSAKTWFGKDVYKARADKTDPLAYTSDNKTIALAKLFGTTKTKQTYKVSYFDDTTTKQFILFGEVSNPKGGWAEFDMEIPATATGQKYIMNADWAVLAIGISDALYAHAH